MAQPNTSKRQSPIRRLVGGIWRTLTVFYALLSLALLILIPLLIYFAVAGVPRVTVEDNVALVWAPIGNLVEQRRHDVPLALLDRFAADRGRETVVRDLIDALDSAATDKRIQLAFLKLDEMGAATSGQLQDLAAAIERFRETGKRVVAWAPAYDQEAYFLAAHADTVYLDPLGFAFVQGYGVFRQYYKEALDKLGVQINVFRVGEYKSFVEPFTRQEMSPQARAANRAWLESLWGTYRESVVSARGLEPGAVAEYVESFDTALSRHAGDAARVALEAGLVDKLATTDQMRDDMSELVGRDAKHGSFRQIFHGDYIRAVRAAKPPPRTDSRIGLVVVEGALVEGESVPGAMGGESVARLIEKVRRDDHMSALVLRVNSPGGSVYASERVRREVVLLRQTGKPVIVSMAGVAASGGYWIAMNADQIWAQPATITGSIGVFGIVPTFEDSLEKVGIRTDGVGTTELAGALRPDRALSPQTKRILQLGVEHAYSRFIREVGEARGMSVEAVDRIAQGRVWSGADAARIGLVDNLGGLEQAVAAAADAAGLKKGDYALQVVQPPGDWRSALLDLFSLRAGMAWLPDWLQLWQADPVLNWLRQGLNDPRDLYAHCFCEPAPDRESP